MRNRRQIRARHDRDHQEGELERADHYRRSFDAAIGSAEDNDQRGGGRHRQSQIARDAIELADAGDGGKFGHHLTGYRHDQRCR